MGYLFDGKKYMTVNAVVRSAFRKHGPNVDAFTTAERKLVVKRDSVIIATYAISEPKVGQLMTVTPV